MLRVPKGLVPAASLLGRIVSDWTDCSCRTLAMCVDLCVIYLLFVHADNNIHKAVNKNFLHLKFIKSSYECEYLILIPTSACSLRLALQQFHTLPFDSASTVILYT